MKPSFRPCDIRIEPMGVVLNSLGSAETEFVAALIVRWHLVNNHTEWQSVSRLEIASLLETDEVARKWVTNPFWQPRPREFMEAGFIEGWASDPTAKGTLTDKFFAGLQKSFDANNKG